ncbi:unnamed protein product [Bursaphelenchus okinawaensis]|uniref:ANK_REP_REGION domain-containing protein n=1 Tax=Bursaphelenchus okinawaensis TaxID=465554 RepID=A0A811KJ66_9BILA|nr:unnamed protein product [Bursaphelenchus okinawaensis]CAG9104815.1 unnamed protein product [Bursaphelenchus okinawaensis]
MLRLRKLSSSVTDLLSTSLSRKRETSDDFMAARYPLHLAVTIGNLVQVRQLVEKGISRIDDEDERGQIALHLAVLSPDTDITEYLIRNKTCVDHSDYFQCTASHLVAKYNKMDQFNLLMAAGADFTLRDRSGKSAFDVVCEFGGTPMLLKLIDNGILKKNFENDSVHTLRQHSALHLAARNGHVEVCYYLITNGFPINIRTTRGSALHEAISEKQIAVITFLLNHHIDLRISDSHGVTVVDLFAQFCDNRNKFSTELGLLLRSYPRRTYAQALVDYYDPDNPDALAFYEHQLIWVIDNNSPVFWKGVIFEEFGYSRAGVFPPELVVIVDKKGSDEMKPSDPSHIYGTSSKMTVRRIKRIEAPVVPDLPGMTEFSRRSRNFSGGSRKSTSTINMLPDLHSCHSNSPSSSRAASSCADPADLASPSFETGTLSRCEMSVPRSGTLSTFQSNNVCLPDRATSGRNSTGSTSSSQNSSGFESGKFENTAIYSTTSFSSYLNSSPLRQNNAINRQFSSTDVYATLEDNNSLDISDMVSKGVPDQEILGEWLQKLGMSQYFSAFILQGFDVSSVSKLTAEDLSALGVTDPRHRKIIHADIQNWCVVDGWPRTVTPTSSTVAWLKAIGLIQYARLFETEGYTTMDKAEELTFEDLEDMGIKKLGHIKRICLALKKLKTCRRKQEMDSSLARPTTSMTTLNYPRHPSQSSLNTNTQEEWRPKAPVSSILSENPQLPRSINGDVLDVGVEQLSLFDHNPPSPAPEPYSTLPPLPLSARLYKINSQDFTRNSTANLARSSTFCSNPSSLC